MRNRRHPHFGSLLSVLVIAAIGAVLLVGTSPARAKIALSGTQSHLSATMTQPTTPAAKAAAAKAAKLKAAQLKAAQLKAAKLKAAKLKAAKLKAAKLRAAKVKAAKLKAA